MKQNKNNEFSSFLRVQVSKLSTKNPNAHSQCAVLGVSSASGKNKDGVALKKGYEDFKSLLERLSKNHEITSKSSCLVRFSGLRHSDHTLFFGLGKDRPGINAIGVTERLRRIGASVFHKLHVEKVKTANIYLDSFLSKEAGLVCDLETAAYAFSEGMGLAAYRFDKYFSKKSEKHESPSYTLIAKDQTELSKFQKGVDHAHAMLLGAEICRNFSNEPSNELYPSEYARQIEALCKIHGLKFTELDEKQCAKEKMGLLLGVGQGSANPPRLILAEYNPKKKAKRTIAFVGKGITFDSGGISIKPSAKMEDMKHDMSGSASVIGAVVACAKLQLPIRVIAVVAAAENMPDGKAICPGNILRARNGKTVEVTNTDAEGRLVLADALDYVQDMKPDYIIDLATLTGAAGITLGKACSGLMGNHEGYNKMLKEAARLSGERVWELPLFDEYFDDLKSDYADMRNSGDAPLNGTAKGAMFLQQFIRENTKWIHLDIAYVANAVPHIPYYPKKSATGYGVRLLVNLANVVK